MRDLMDITDLAQGCAWLRCWSWRQGDISVNNGIFYVLKQLINGGLIDGSAKKKTPKQPTTQKTNLQSGEKAEMKVEMEGQIPQ